jgi:acetyl-CoA carboxylase biotin carboxylase subunit
MIAKFITFGKDREGAVSHMSDVLRTFKVSGIHTTIPFHQAVLKHPDFRNNQVTTRWVEETFMKQINSVKGAA